MRKILIPKNNSFIISLGFSAFLHALIIVVFGIWGKNYPTTATKDNVPNDIQINLIESEGNPKISALEVVNNGSKKMATGQTLSESFVGPIKKVDDNNQTGPKSSMDEGGDSGSSNGAETTTLKQKYFLEFRSIIDTKKEYPRMAKIRGIEGTVVVSVTIKKNGEVLNHKIIKASGSDVLDQSALNLVKKINIFKSFPNEFGIEDLELNFPIAYSLNG